MYDQFSSVRAQVNVDVNSPDLPSVCIVRHGETAWTVTGQHTGRTDLQLSPRGEEQARQLSARLRDIRFRDVFTSPLQRARRTCELAGFTTSEPLIRLWNES